LKSYLRAPENSRRDVGIYSSLGTNYCTQSSKSHCLCSHIAPYLSWMDIFRFCSAITVLILHYAMGKIIAKMITHVYRVGKAPGAFWLGRNTGREPAHCGGGRENTLSAVGSLCVQTVPARNKTVYHVPLLNRVAFVTSMI